jgi:RNA:NAD 2'-phosphotransferase (TPT1/KptA family)
MVHLGACNSRTASELAVVFRSREDRFGARLLEVGFSDIRLLVSRPPKTLEAAQRMAAEHVAFSDEAHRGLR